MTRQRWALLLLVAGLYFLGGLVMGDLWEDLKRRVPHPPPVEEVEQAIERGDL